MPALRRTSSAKRLGVLAAAVFAVAAYASSVGEAAELVMFEEDGCVWCERWLTEVGPVYAKTEEGARAPLRQVDIHDRRPKDLANIKPWPVFTPTFVLLDDDGAEVGRVVGYPGEDLFWWILSEPMKILGVDPAAGS